MGESLTPLPIAWIERIFDAMAKAYGIRFTDMWAGQSATAIKHAWAAGLAGMEPDDLGRGLAACLEGEDWPPSLPKFRKLCRPMPSYEAAFYEAVEQIRRRDEGVDAWSHPAVFWAAVRVGNDLKMMSYSLIKTRWHVAYDAAMADVRSGALPGQVPDKNIALPAPGHSTPSREVAKQYLAEMKRIVGIGSESDQQRRAA